MKNKIIERLKIKINTPYLEDKAQYLLSLFKVDSIYELTEEKLIEFELDIDHLINGGLL
jgi:hypothetical protein